MQLGLFLGKASSEAYPGCSGRMLLSHTLLYQKPLPAGKHSSGLESSLPSRHTL